MPNHTGGRPNPSKLNALRARDRREIYFLLALLAGLAFWGVVGIRNAINGLQP